MTRQTLNSIEAQAPDVQVTPERFWILLLFGLSTMINAVGWISMAPVYSLVEDLYNVGPLMVNMMSYSFMVLFLPMNFPCVYITDRYGLRWGVIGGIASTAIGLWIRCLLNVHFSFALIGQVIMALG
mmetsp:Transcript_22949/g.28481  ORF Transcript_22949/g.28481 Transcript_22949/m.28481 type:complete len:127 (+) Transcript_22949:114-494(+)